MSNFKQIIIGLLSGLLIVHLPHLIIRFTFATKPASSEFYFDSPLAIIHFGIGIVVSKIITVILLLVLFIKFIKKEKFIAAIFIWMVFPLTAFGAYLIDWYGNYDMYAGIKRAKKEVYSNRDIKPHKIDIDLVVINGNSIDGFYWFQQLVYNSHPIKIGRILRIRDGVTEKLQYRIYKRVDGENCIQNSLINWGVLEFQVQFGYLNSCIVNEIVDNPGPHIQIGTGAKYRRPYGLRNVAVISEFTGKSPEEKRQQLARWEWGKYKGFKKLVGTRFSISTIISELTRRDINYKIDTPISSLEDTMKQIISFNERGYFKDLYYPDRLILLAAEAQTAPGEKINLTDRQIDLFVELHAAWPVMKWWENRKRFSDRTRRKFQQLGIFGNQTDVLDVTN